MIKLEHIEVLGFKHAIRGMRNPLNSWNKSDSQYMFRVGNLANNDPFEHYYAIGENDLKLAQNLCKAGTDHRKFMRMITVYIDITAPLYWWKEFDTYKVGTVANSCSTMHKIHDKKFVTEDFSLENLSGDFDTLALVDIELNDCENLPYGEEIQIYPRSLLDLTINVLNVMREKYLETKDKKYWWQMIQLLPSSYNQKRTVMLNYEVLANMYHSRKSHKLDEWVEFCKEIEKLPYFKEICL